MLIPDNCDCVEYSSGILIPQPDELPLCLDSSDSSSSSTSSTTTIHPTLPAYCMQVVVDVLCEDGILTVYKRGIYAIPCSEVWYEEIDCLCTTTTLIPTSSTSSTSTSSTTTTTTTPVPTTIVDCMDVVVDIECNAGLITVYKQAVCVLPCSEEYYDIYDCCCDGSSSSSTSTSTSTTTSYPYPEPSYTTPLPPRIIFDGP